MCILRPGKERSREMRLRVNVTLPEETVRLIDRVARKGNRSRFIDQAVRHYVDQVGKASLRRLLKEAAVRRAARDLRLAHEWFAVEEEVWPRNRS